MPTGDFTCCTPTTKDTCVDEGCSREETKKMERLKIITCTKVQEPTPWVSSLVDVHKNGGNVRI